MKKIIAATVALVGLFGVVSIASADECYHGNNNAYYAPTYVPPAQAYYPPAQAYYPPAPVVTYRPAYRAPIVRVCRPVRHWNHWGRR